MGFESGSNRRAREDLTEKKLSGGPSITNIAQSANTGGVVAKSPELHDGHVKEYKLEKHRRGMEEQSKRLKFEAQLKGLREQYTGRLMNILQGVPKIAQMIAEIHPNSRVMSMNNRPQFAENYYGMGGVGNYDTNEGEWKLENLIRENVGRKDREPLIETRDRIYHLREDFFRNALRLEKEAGLDAKFDVST